MSLKIERLLENVLPGNIEMRTSVLPGKLTGLLPTFGNPILNGPGEEGEDDGEPWGGDDPGGHGVVK